LRHDLGVQGGAAGCHAAERVDEFADVADTERVARTLSDGFDATERAQIAAVIPLLERLADEL
jgi:hypothetical protein